MEEIAAEAVVSKSTLYEAFGNKDAALAAAIRLANGTAIADLRSAWDEQTGLGNILDH